jgi:hypothetical protein
VVSGVALAGSASQAAQDGAGSGGGRGHGTWAGTWAAGITGLPGCWTPEKDANRQAVNTYPRTHPWQFDGVVDFDAVLRDPAHPSQLRADLDAGDHIRPNDAGNQLLADAVPMALLR